MSLSDDEETRSPDGILIPRSPGVFGVVNVADEIPILTDIFVQYQDADPDYEEFSPTACMTRLDITYDRYSFFMSRSGIDGALKKVVP